jgi:hypothetical protein
MRIRLPSYLLPVFTITGLLILTACNLPISNSASQIPEAIKTAAALTVEALQTQFTVETLPATIHPAITATAQPINFQPSATPIVSSTPTQNPIPCDRAGFVNETIPDKTSFVKGSSFIKTWTLKNTGSCSWNSAYTLAFVKGDAMGGQPKQLTTGTVAPGETVEISFNLRAPTTIGEFKGEWVLRNADGIIFGLGSNADQTFWVQITVTELSNSFVNDMCAAVWRNNSETLLCPGTAGDLKGFVLTVNNPKFENGTIENESALWMNPPVMNDGYIAGEFPPIDITAGDHFKTVIGCQYNALHCYVRFSVTFRADGGTETLLNEWNEGYDNNWTKIDEDLSSLAGKSVVFTLYVKSFGVSDQDEALWLLPRITK